MRARFGAFGKMPNLGDFFRSNLPQGFVDAWDAWVQQAMIEAKDDLGEGWQECYMSAPIWRFTLAGGLAGALPMLGVVMPSVDRVGRQFPLTLAAPLPDDVSPLLGHFVSGPAFVELEGISLDALDDATDREALESRLAGVKLPALSGDSRVALGDGVLVQTRTGAFGPLPELCATLAGQRFNAPSVWSADVTGGLRLMVCEGLPGAGKTTGLFDLAAEIWSGGGAE